MRALRRVTLTYFEPPPLPVLTPSNLFPKKGFQSKVEKLRRKKERRQKKTSNMGAAS